MVTLNRHSFAGNVQNVFRQTLWVVKFCHKWFEPCIQTENHFREKAAYWEEKLNPSTVLEPAVRFAEVDCSIDKNLCNAEGVKRFPAVVAYHKGLPMNAFVLRWKSEQSETDSEKEYKRFGKWLQRMLQPNEAGSTTGSTSQNASEEPNALGRDLTLAAIVLFGTTLIFGGNYYMIQLSARQATLPGAAEPKTPTPHMHNRPSTPPLRSATTGTSIGKAQCPNASGKFEDAQLRIRVPLRSAEACLEL